MKQKIVWFIIGAVAATAMAVLADNSRELRLIKDELECANYLLSQIADESIYGRTRYDC